MTEYVMHVPPSGDTSGATDALALQQAIDQLQGCVPDQAMGLVTLAGRYYTDRTIRIGAPGVPARVCLHGLGTPTITRRGVVATDYMLCMYGGNAGPKEVLRNLRFFCSYKSRGLLLAYTQATTSVEGVQVYNYRQVGMDLIDCWWTHLRCVQLMYGRGYGVRTREANGCHYDSLHFMNCLSADWPSATDDACVDYWGKPFRTLVDQRSMLFLHGNGNVVTNSAWECQTGEYPLIHLPADASTNLFQGMRLEGNLQTRQKIICRGNNNVFQHIGTSDGKPLNGNDWSQCAPAVACKTFLRLQGKTRCNVVERLFGNAGLTESIVTFDGGEHTGTIVRECSTACAIIPADKWITAQNSPIVVPNWPDATYGPPVVTT
jgi:hypothetical protein